MADIKSLEHSTLILPYDLLNKTFRNAQKVIDREISKFNGQTDSLKELASKNEVAIDEATSECDRLLEKLEGLKEKCLHAVEQEENRLVVCQDRLQHVIENTSTIANKRNRLDRMIINFLLRSGQYQSALKLSDSSFVKDYVDLDIFLAARDIEKSLMEHKASLCLQWCHNNKSKLKKLQSTLEANIRIQEFIELIKSEQRLKAVKYARKHFSTSSEITVLFVEKKVMLLLALKPDTQLEHYRELFDVSRWNSLIEQFRKENFALHQLPSQSILEVVLQCGLASLKTPQCFHDDENNPDCPVCYRLFNELSKPLPFAHSSQSRLLCSISGERLNEHNHPLMLPNGNVFGENSIQTMAFEGEGQIVCPKTGKTYAIDELKKVFIM